MHSYDLVVVGAGIVGLAHALAGARRGARVLVVDRDARANGASVRNFGFVTVTGQAEGDTYRRALRSREVWDEVAPAAGIAVAQRGAVVVARRREALDVLVQYARGHDGTKVWSGPEIRRQLPRLRDYVAGALVSEHELRVEAREALPRLARWLEQHHGVEFRWGVTAGRDLPEARAVVIAPGTSVAEFAPEISRRLNFHLCRLQMLRVAVAPDDFRLPATVMSDLSLLRYEGFASQPAARQLRAKLERECGAQLANGIHLIAAQSSDGTLVIGDSHHYGEVADPFAPAEAEALILGELAALFDLPAVRVVERWVGYYPVADLKPLVREALGPNRHLVAVTNGLGMSTAFAIGEETIAALFP